MSRLCSAKEEVVSVLKAGLAEVVSAGETELVRAVGAVGTLALGLLLGRLLARRDELFENSDVAAVLERVLDGLVAGLLAEGALKSTALRPASQQLAQTEKTQTVPTVQNTRVVDGRVKGTQTALAFKLAAGLGGRRSGSRTTWSR